MHKVMSGDARTGRRILESSGLHAPSDVTVDLMRSKFITSGSGDTLAGNVNLKERAKKCKPVQVSEKVVGKLVSNLKDCKAAGTSGWRNSRLKAIASIPEGARALTDWVRIWTSAKVPEHMAHEWRAVLGIPLRKGSDGMDVRPILIGEALLSLPGAYLQYATQARVTKILAKTQFGMGVVAGPETMMGIAQALTKLSPDDVFGALDVINAFGEISRAKILKEILVDVPEIAPFLLQL